MPPTTTDSKSHSLIVERKDNQLWIGRFQAMASPCEVLLECPELDREAATTLVNIAAAEAWRIEQKFSRYRSDNIIAGIHASAGEPVEVDGETADLLDYADRCFHLSEGKFDISSGPLRNVWKFRGEEFTPDLAQLAAILAKVGWQKCRWQRPHLTLPAGAEIDLGGIGKEYAVDRTVHLLSNAMPVLSNAMSASCKVLVNYGGDIACSGPRANNIPWSIGLEKTSAQVHDFATEEVIPLYRGGIATSGDTHRFLLHRGERLSHILDPQTGWPVRGAPHRVTVMASSCTLAGMLATFAMLQGADAEHFLSDQGFPFWIQRD